MTVLVLAQDDDHTADAVTHELIERGTRVFRCDLSWFPERLSLTGRLSDGRWAGALKTPDWIVDFDDITAVWWRRPTWPTWPKTWSGSEQRHAEWETKFGLGGILATLPARWYNTPEAERRLAHKPHQLVVASEAGLTVPATLITNHAPAVDAFAGSVAATVIKPLAFGMIERAGVLQPLYTHALTTGELADLSGVEVCPHLFQARIAKAFEVRVTMVDRTFFAARIDAHSKAGRIDFRSDYGALTYEAVTMPGEVEAALTRFADHLGIRLVTFDFAVTPEGTWTFFEANGAGSQYRWLEAPVNVDITGALADALGKASQ